MAAQSHLRAGSFDAALETLAVAESEAFDEFVAVRVELLRGLVASASNAGSDASVRLVRAARRLERLDRALARQTYSDAWAAAMYAGHLAGPGGNLVDVSLATLAAPRPDVPRGPFGQVIDGLAILVSDSRAAAEPVLRGALRRLFNEELPADNWLHWGVLGAVAAAAVWDVDSWRAVITRQVELARELGALSVLPAALSVLAMVATWRGEFEAAAVLAAEHDAIKEATGIQVAPYGAMLLSAYRGRVLEASALIAATSEESADRGEGLGIDLARWSAAILHNGVGQYANALAMASPVSGELPGLLVSTWMLPERVEAAVRCEQPELARAALAEFERTANPGQSDWGLGVEARSRAMLSDGEEAEDLYREAVARLGRRPHCGPTRPAPTSVRGVAPPREPALRRADQLRTAYEMFVAMGADGIRRAGSSGAAGHGRERPQAAGRDTAPSSPPGGAHRPAGPRRTHQPRDRRGAVPQRPHRRMAPAQGVHQAGDHLPTRVAGCPAGPCPESSEPPTGSSPVDLRRPRRPDGDLDGAATVEGP